MTHCIVTKWQSDAQHKDTLQNDDSKMTLNIMTLCKMTLCKMKQQNDTQQNDILHSNKMGKRIVTIVTII